MAPSIDPSFIVQGSGESGAEELPVCEVQIHPKSFKMPISNSLVRKIKIEENKEPLFDLISHLEDSPSLDSPKSAGIV